MSKLWSFGDSWAYGWAGQDIPAFTDNYINLLGEKLGCAEVENLARPGLGLGIITEVFMSNSPRIEKNDIVIITLPPDSRWYSPKQEILPDYPSNMATISISGAGPTSEKYAKFLDLIDYDLYWFEYHNSLFVTAIADACERIGCECLMQHNYGMLNLLPWTNDRFILDKNHSMWEWLGLPALDTFQRIEQEDGLALGDIILSETLTELEKEQIMLLVENAILKDQETGGWDLHPNLNSHKQIAEKIYELRN